MNYLNFETGHSNAMYNWGGFRNFSIGVGGGGRGGSNFVSEKTVELF